MLEADYRTALPSPNALKVLRTLVANKAWWLSRDQLVSDSGVPRAHVFEHLTQLQRLGLAESTGGRMDRWYAATPKGQRALDLANQISRLNR